MSWLRLLLASLQRLISGRDPVDVAKSTASNAAHKAAAEAAADVITRSKK